MTLLVRILSTCLLAATALLSGCTKDEGPLKYAQLNLRSYGVGTYDWGEGAVSYNQIAFLSDRLLLISVNQRVSTEPVELMKIDVPPSKLLLYDVSLKAVVKSAEMQIEKQPNVLQPLADLRFVIWNSTGFRICDADLICGKPISSSDDGPVFASPAGTSFMVGAYGEEQIVFSSNSLTEIGRYPSRKVPISPGDGSLLLRHEPDVHLSIKQGDKPESLLSLVEGARIAGSLLSSRFLNENTVGVSESVESLLVATVDGKPLYRVPVFPWYHGTALFTAAGGKKFGVRDSTYTRWNSFIKFYDFNRPYNLERVRVLEIETGRPLFDVEWDPRPYINSQPLPALSPDGHRLALIHRGSLNLYDIP